MELNTTCVPVNGSACAAPNSPVYLAVGLTLFFLLLVAIAIATVGKFCKHKWNPPPSDRKKSPKKERTGTPRLEQPYACQSRTQPAENNPIYENLAGRRSGDRPQSRCAILFLRNRVDSEKCDI